MANIIQGEWVGKKAKVVAAPNKSVIGIEGVIVDETKNLVVIETASGVKKVLKKGAVFMIGNEEVVGDAVMVAPQERMKLKVS